MMVNGRDGLLIPLKLIFMSQLPIRQKLIFFFLCQSFTGMANCRKPNPKFEDKKLQEFLDGAHEGVVYVSFGSVLKASEMSPEKLKDLLKVRGCLAEKFSSIHFVNVAISGNDT